MKALLIWEAQPTPSESFVLEIQAEGYRDGLAWGHVDVHPDAREWLVLLVPTVSITDTSADLTAEAVCFVRHRFCGTDAAVFVRDGLDVERVVKVLPSVVGRAA